jgi:phage terminase large subunit
MTDIRVTKVFAWNYEAKSRFVINQGGSRSGKTYAILQVLCFLAMERKGITITVTAETLPALKKGALRDFGKIIMHQPFLGWVESEYKGVPHTFTFTNGSMIEFVAFPTEDAATHGSRDYLFMNEANHISFEIAKQLMMRTGGQVFIDFNPTADFWAHEKYMANPKAKWIFTTYRDNAFAPAAMVEEIEAMKTDSPEHYRVYGLGKRGNLSGQIFPNVTYVESFPEYASNVTYGMDIGFSNSYTALVKIGQADGFIYGQELIYERGLLEPDIIERMDALNISKSARILVDNAAPMVIEYLCRYGDYNAIPCAKKDVKSELAAMKRHKWRITNDSVSWKKEFKNYIYKKNPSGGLLNEPVKLWDDLQDASRYAFLDIFEGTDGLFFFQ